MTRTSTIGRKTNKAFMILSALGILFVVDSHLSSGIFPFTQIFPYDSFFMPMFSFISGYFFSDKQCQSWNSVLCVVKRKIKNLLLPYLGWICFYGILTIVLRAANVWEIGAISWIDLIQNILTSGTSFFFNDPAWFVPLLFCVIVFYTILRRLFNTHWNDVLAMVVFSLLGATAVALSQTEFCTHNTFMLLKVPCFTQYYHLGVLFRRKLEPRFDQANSFIVCIGATLINCLLLSVYGYDMSFPLYATMDGFQPSFPFLPLITSITGIAFWLKISKNLVPILGNNPVINYISEHTSFIMTHHLFVKHLFIGLLLLAQRLGATCFGGIDVDAYRKYAWYTYTEYPWCNTLCYLFTIAVLLLWCKGSQRIVEHLSLFLRNLFCKHPSTLFSFQKDRH